MNLYQSIWCLSFRPKFTNFLWFPASLLGAAASCLLIGLNNISNGVDFIKSLDSREDALYTLILVLFRFPLSLHAGWLSAATLLNLNGWISYKRLSIPAQISAAYFSIFTAFVLGVFTSLKFKDPFLAFTVAWATAALSYQAKLKSKEDVNKDSEIILSSLSITEDILYKLLVVIGIVSPVATDLF